MSSQTELLSTTLRSAGYSLTAPRLQVFHALHNSEPLSIRQLVAHCPDIDRASVYRTVALLEKLHIIQRLQQGWKYTLELSDTFHDHHHHATCSRCGMSIKLAEDEQLENVLEGLASKHAFRMDHHQIELQGVCRNCQLQAQKIA